MAYHFDIFISSTKTDLEDFREVANGAIRTAGMFPIDMADFQPEAGNALQVCYNAVQQAEAFIGIYAHKYGYCPDATVTYVDKDGNTRAGDGVTSITEWEYKWAIEKGIPIMLFLVNPDTAWKPSLMEKGAGAEGLEKFKAHIGKNHIVKFFETLADFEKALPYALMRAYRELSDIALDRMARAPRTREQIEADEKRILSVVATPKPKYTGKIRFINPLPKIFGKDDFFDRIDHQAQATNLLTERRAMVSIYGKGGIGKTALACKVLNDFATNNHEVGLAVFRMDDSPRPSAEFMLLALAKFLPDEHPVLETLKQPAISIRDKTLALINGMAGGQYMVYLDNFESVQHPDSHHIADEYIEAMVTAILERGGGVLQLLITSRYPIPFEARLKALEKIVRIDEGLGNEDAIAFMREMDGNNHALPEDDTALHEFIHKTGGYPRALEALVGYLGQSVTHHIEDFTDNPALWDDNVMSNIVDKIHNTLPASFRKVVGAIAIIGQASTQEELEYALAPFIEMSAIRHILARLAEGRFVVYNRQTRTYGLHHYDLRYATESVPIGEYNDKFADEAPFTRYSLYHRMAEFYASKRKPQEEWQSITDLEPQLREIKFRMALGDYETAAQILFSIDWDYLLLWGHPLVVHDLHTALQGKLTTRWIMSQSANNLGLACWQMGRAEEAIRHYETALAINREDSSRRSSEGAVLGSLGLAYHDLGQIESAIDYHQQALAISREVNDRRGEGIDLGNLGNAYRDLGQIESAIDLYQLALAISRETKNRWIEGYDLGYLGTAYLIQRDYAQAVSYLSQASTILTEVKDVRGLQWYIANLALTYWHSGDTAQAVTTIRQARAYDVPDGNHLIAVRHGAIAWCAGHADEAKTAYTDALRHADDLIHKTPKLYDAHYACALTYVGLWLLGDADAVVTARGAYVTARGLCDAKGVLMEQKMLLEALLACSDADGSALVGLLG